MEAIRKIISVEMLSPIISLPWEKNMQVEVIIMPIAEEISRQEIIPEYSTVSQTVKLSDKYKGVFSEEAGKSFMEHIKNMREE